MPDPPDVNFFTHYVLENPWPAGLSLLALAIGITWMGLREGLMKRVKLGAAIGAIGAAALLAGYLVVTSGENAKSIARRLVDAAVAGDSIGAVNLFADSATFNVGSPRNPAMGIDFIRDQIVRLLQRYKINSNSITMLRGYSESGDAATVHLACLTEVNEFPAPNLSSWVLRVQRQPNGEWKITQLTCIAINNQTPPLEGVR